MEANEVQEYAKQMKEAGEIGREPFRRISLGISILAVLVAMVLRFLAIAATPRRS